MKRAAFIPIVLALSTTYLMADTNTTPQDDNDNTYTTRTAVMAITQKNVHGTVGGKSATHLRSKGPFITADFLYWRADEDGLEFATKSRQNSSGTCFKTNDLNFHGEWRPGVRAGIGWLFGECDQWDVYANWTFFYDKAHKSDSGKLGKTTFIPTWSPILGPVATRAQAGWNLHLNAIDLEVGRNYFISRKIALRPHAGLRGVWIDQDVSADYHGYWYFQTTNTGAYHALGASTSFKGDLDYKAIGVRGGADLLWHFTDHFGIQTLFSGALLYGPFNVDERFEGAQQTATSGGSPDLAPLKVRYKKDFNRVRANLEAFAGLFFETGISNDKFHFFLSAGYELSEWFQQNELVTLDIEKESQVFKATAQIPPSILQSVNTTTVGVNRSGDLGLQGLTIKLGFNF